jgi:hypothetical protein
MFHPNNKNIPTIQKLTNCIGSLHQSITKKVSTQLKSTKTLSICQTLQFISL